MQDICIREIISIGINIEKMILKQIRKVMKMYNTGKIKIAILFWYEGLEKLPKAPGKKRKTVIDHKKLVRNAGVHFMRIEEKMEDMKEWA